MGRYISKSLMECNSDPLRHVPPPAFCNARMHTIEEIRRINLQALLKKHGTLVALSTQIGLTSRDSTLSQILNQSAASNSNKRKAMGSTLARKIETMLGIEVGWMDNLQSSGDLDHSHTDAHRGEAPQVHDVDAGQPYAFRTRIPVAIELLGKALAADIDADLRQDISDALAKLAIRRGQPRDIQTLIALLLDAIASLNVPRAAGPPLQHGQSS